MAKKDDIKIIRLLNGEEILAELIWDDHCTLDKIAIRQPVKIMVIPTRTDPNNPQVGFVPYCPFSAQKDYHIFKNAIVTIIDPIPEFIDQYNGIFSPILQPSVATQTPTKLIL